MNAVIQLCGFSPCPDIGLEPYMHPLPSGGALRVWLCREHAAQLWSIASVVAPLPSDEALGQLRELVTWVNDPLAHDGRPLWEQAEALVERTSQGDET